MKALYKWFAYKLPIRSKLLISFSILVMVPILVLGIYSYQQSKENTERQIRSTMESNLARLTSELDTRFQREGSTVRFLAYNLTFRNALENSGASAMTMAQVSRADLLVLHCRGFLCQGNGGLLHKGPRQNRQLPAAGG